jgi:CHAT domain-containing protein
LPAAAGALPVHRLHDEEIERLLATGERRQELVALFGERAYRELSALARRAATRRATGGPRVYVLPGLMGSRIGTRGRLLDDVLWVDLIEIAAGHLTRLALPKGASLVTLGAILLNALKLKLSLKVAGFDAHLHAYDWRRSVGTLATELNARIDADTRRRSVALVGHSMGGVVARVALGRRTDSRIERVVQLGAPNHGSFACVLALRGVYPTVRKLAALDRRHSAEDLARIIFRTLPALHELLPDPRLAGGVNLFDAAEWPDDSLRPDPEMLKRAAEEQAGWPELDERCLHVAGVRQDTVIGVMRRDGGFDFKAAPAGDGTVPLALAVRAGERAWYVGEKHGGLPNNGRVIAAVVDLLRTGTTTRLPQTAAAPRRRLARTVSEATLRRVAPHKVALSQLSPDARRRLLEPVVSPEFHGGTAAAALERSPADTGRSTVAPARRRTLELRLVQGNLAAANARALVLGVFRNVDPSGPATTIDAALDGAIREFTLRRMFSGALGQVFLLPSARSVLLAELVLFAGLGDFDDFGSEAQAFVAENVVRTLAHTRVEDFATVLFGAGSGLPVAAAVEHQLRGFLEGLRHGDPDGVVRRVTICEINRAKYRSLQRAVHRLAPTLAGDDFELVVDESAAPTAAGRATPTRAKGVTRTRADPAYLLITLREQGRTEYECRSSLLTAGAKAAVLSGTRSFSKRELQAALEPVEQESPAPQDFARPGTRLARLLLARSVEEGLADMSTRPLVVVHDREASRVPWEVLRIGREHPALGHGLSRRYASETLSVARWRDDRAPGERPRVLLIVDPTLDLPGAADEGRALLALFEEADIEPQVLEGREATRVRVLQALGSGTYDVLHFAGHGFFDPAAPGRSGLLCAGEQVLRGADLDGLGHLPAMVFFNACEAARVRKPSRRKPQRLLGLRQSASIAEAFLSGGVAEFLGTHWPVGDEAALAFSTTCYRHLLAGADLGAAVLAGRREVLARGSHDWADYVHYGHPDFRLAT